MLLGMWLASFWCPMFSVCHSIAVSSFILCILRVRPCNRQLCFTNISPYFLCVPISRSFNKMISQHITIPTHFTKHAVWPFHTSCKPRMLKQVNYKHKHCRECGHLQYTHHLAWKSYVINFRLPHGCLWLFRGWCLIWSIGLQMPGLYSQL